jgi:exosortase A
VTAATAPFTAPALAGEGRWRATGLALAVVIAWLLFWYRGTAEAMVGIWMHSDTFMHCFLIPPIVLWLAWRRRTELAALAPAPDWRNLALVAVIAFGWLLGELAAVNVVTQFALVSLLVLAVPALCGWRVAGAIALPLAFLFFSVPFGDFVMPRMMEWTADFTVTALRLSGIPVYREGLQFVLPSGNWSVVEACSGIRYLIASITVGTLFAYLNFYSLKRRAAFLVLAVAVPIVANWLRAYGIVMIGHLSGNQLAVGVDHIIYGWVFFGVVILLMFVIGGRWADNPPPARAASATVAVQAGSRKSPWPAAVAFMILAALPPLATWMMEHRDPLPAPQVQLPEQAGDFRRAAQLPAEWKPVFVNPSSEVRAGYAGPRGVVGVYIAYYRQQGHDRKLVSSENTLVRSKDAVWAQVARGSTEAGFNGQAVKVISADLRGSGLDRGGVENRLVAWQWYWIGGRLTSSDFEAKARIALLRLLGQPDDSAVIVLYAPADQPGGAQAALGAFAQAAGASLDAALRKAGSRHE